MFHAFIKGIHFLEGPTNAFGFTKVILLQSNHVRVLATHAADFSGEHKDVNKITSMM